jgi:hypothetical protein
MKLMVMVEWDVSDEDIREGMEPPPAFQYVPDALDVEDWADYLTDATGWLVRNVTRL